MSGGRPTTYTPELAALICERIATHDCGLARLCALYEDMPDKTTIHLWRHKHNEFSIQYTEAKKEQIELLAEQIIDIADDTSHDVIMDLEGNERFNSEFAARSRIRIDTRKWLASKLAPKIYGDKSIDNTKSQNTLIEKLLEKL